MSETPRSRRWIEPRIFIAAFALPSSRGGYARKVDKKAVMSKLQVFLWWRGSKSKGNSGARANRGEAPAKSRTGQVAYRVRELRRVEDVEHFSTELQTLVLFHLKTL